MTTAPPAPQVVNNRYRLDGLLGRGGMGEVYRVTDLTTDTPLVMKRLLLKHSASDTLLRQRFAHEIGLALKVTTHPNLNRVLDGGEDMHGVFVVLEPMPEENLEQVLLKSTRFEWQRALAIARHVCAGLLAMHTAKVVHRDLKAANVFLRTDEQGAEVAVLDFGIVRALTQFTSSNMLLRTAEYASPEQIAGLRIDERADVYSVGVLLFRMLTGQTAFDDLELTRVIYGHRHTPVRSLIAIEPSVPTSVEWVVQRCLSKDPWARFDDMKKLDAALADIEQGRFDAAQVMASAMAAPPGSKPGDEIAGMAFAMPDFDITTGVAASQAKPDEKKSAPKKPVMMTPLHPVRLGRVLLELESQSLMHLKPLMALSWAARLAPAYDENDRVLRHMARVLERKLGELLKQQGSMVFTFKNEVLSVDDELVVLPVDQGDMGGILAWVLERRGLDRLGFLKAPGTEDVSTLMRLFRAGLVPQADTLNAVRLVWKKEVLDARNQPATPVDAWRRVMDDVNRLVNDAWHGQAFDYLRALHVADVIVAEASWPGRRLVGVMGRYDGTDALSAQATNAAFLATTIALDLGLSAKQARDIAQLCIATSVIMVQVYPRAYAAPGQLTNDERAVLRQSLYSVIRQGLQEVATGPATWRRLVLSYELASEIARGIDASLGQGEVVDLPPSLPTRIAFAAMTYWSLRAPRSHVDPLTPEQIHGILHGPLKGRLDEAVLTTMDRVLAGAESLGAKDVILGAQFAVMGSPKSSGLAAAEQPIDPNQTKLTSLVTSLASSGLEPKDRLVEMVQPIVDALLMQGDFAALNAMLRRLKQGGVNRPDGVEAALASDVIRGLTDDKSLMLLQQVLNEGPLRDVKEFNKTLAFVEGPDVPQLLQLLALVTHPESLFMLGELLAPKIKQSQMAPAAMADLIRASPEQMQAELLVIMAKSNDRSALAMQLIDGLWGVVSTKTQVRLLDAVSLMASGEAAAFAKKAATGTSAEVRIAALQCLGVAGMPQANSILLELAQAIDFESRPAREREVMYEALATRGHETGFALLFRFVSAKPPLLGRAKFFEERKLLIMAMVNVGGLPCVEMLQRLMGDSKQSSEIRTMAKEGFEQLRRQMSGITG
ncbi:MAG: serine/threonine protein kinase [Archangium sp.]|nr:serine/threonine protein kinase [Archangium sp.]